MMPVIRIPDPLYKRLQDLAVPFEDTPITVLERLLDDYEARHKIPQTNEHEKHRVLNTDAPSDLHHSRIIRASISGTEIRRPNWNRLVQVAHEFAFRQGMSQDALIKLTQSNVIKGENNNFGFHFLPEVNISVQGVDANLAWRNTLHLAKSLKVPVEVWFEWRDKEGAAYPGEIGKLSWSPD
jgi:hypothetical protein